MLLDFNQLVRKYGVRSKGVIQVGAHWGQEYVDYINNGIDRIVFVEPCQKAFTELVQKFGESGNVKLLNCACGDIAGEAVMNTGDNTVNKGMSNSLLKPAEHLRIHPEVAFDSQEQVKVDLLDNLGLATGEYDLLVMDCQGYEGYVLRGGKETLKHINYVYSEINFGNVYEGNTLSEELDELLSDFFRVETGPKVGGLWSDCFYVRKSLLNAGNN